METIQRPLGQLLLQPRLRQLKQLRRLRQLKQLRRLRLQRLRLRRLRKSRFAGIHDLVLPLRDLRCTVLGSASAASYKGAGRGGDAPARGVWDSGVQLIRDLLLKGCCCCLSDEVPLSVLRGRWG